jgi:hypothetical protein
MKAFKAIVKIKKNGHLELPVAFNRHLPETMML